MIYVVGTPKSLHGDSLLWRRATPRQVLAHFERIDQIEVDSESQGLDPHQHRLLTLQLGDGHHQFVIDLRHVPLSLFAPLLEQKLCLLHNAKHDYKFFKKAGLTLDRIYDTMLAECVIYNGYERFGYELTDLHRRYLGTGLDKEPRGKFERLGSAPLTDELIAYAARDVTNLGKIRDRQAEAIARFDLGEAVARENRALKAIADIELTGFWLDAAQWMDVARRNKAELRARQIHMDRFILDLDLGYRANGQQDAFGAQTRPLSLNYGSPPQTLDLLRRAGLPVNSTGADALEPYAGRDIVKNLTEVREARTRASRYGEAFLEHINPVTGRVHTDFWQIKNTFRLGSSEPNMQNIPRSNVYRNCFKPRPGYKLISLDYSGQEMRLMADYSEEWELINAINRGEDPHCFVGTMMLGESLERDDPRRQEMKIINFGKPYGMGPPKLARKLNIDEAAAAAKLRLHEATFPALDRWLKDQGAFGVARGYALTNSLHKGRRWFPLLRRARELRAESNPNWSYIYRLEGAIEREAMNLPIQGTGAVMMKEALSGLRELIEPYDAQMVNTVHDEAILEVAEDQAPKILGQARELMQDVGQRFVRHLAMPVDGDITDYWKK